ncbi:hypothetical protein [uncultured Salegentibacter sp.]|uniref:hypothetical protein n=1 Tax=uncultured Salegentibacter sp. TaxID=259320 RepID=UPI0030DABA5B|tara:strand:- start:767 stop:991 length:225 start_codon:yes stop_codon:yes gene_type:complete
MGVVSHGLSNELVSEKEAHAQATELEVEGENQKAVQVRCPSTGVLGTLCDAGGTSCEANNPCQWYFECLFICEG